MNRAAVLNPEAGITAIQWAVTSRQPRQMLRRRLAEMLEPGCRIGPLHLSRVKYKPHRKLLAYYNFTVSDPHTGRTRTVPLAVTWGPLAAPPEQESLDQQSIEMQAEAGRRGLLSPFLQLQQDIPEWGVRVQVWPLDPAFPQLVRLGSPGYAQRLFQSSGIAIPFEDEDCVKITPIRYRPGERHVLRYQVLTGDDPAETNRLYAKLYQDSQSAARAYRIAHRVVNWLESNLAGLQGVRPAGISEEDAVILYPHAAGIPLSKQLHRSPAWLDRQLQLVGKALSSLHDGPETLTLDLEETTFAKEVKVITRAGEHVQVLLPETGAILQRILVRAQELHASLPQEKPTFTHSDFKSDHLLIGPAGITLIDFDTCALADPALDIGKFLADLEWWHEQAGVYAFERAQQAFLRGYQNTDKLGRLARAQLWHSLILAKIAIRRARLYSRNWATLTTKMIRRSETILQELALENLP
jgi:hypothetical protein